MSTYGDGVEIKLADQVYVARRYRGVRTVDVRRTGIVNHIDSTEPRMVGVLLDHGNAQPKEARTVAVAALRFLARGAGQ